jgi:hypothetical protein
MPWQRQRDKARNIMKMQEKFRGNFLDRKLSGKNRTLSIT